MFKKRLRLGALSIVVIGLGMMGTAKSAIAMDPPFCSAEHQRQCASFCSDYFSYVCTEDSSGYQCSCLQS